MASVEQECLVRQPLLYVNDHFPKIIVVGDDIRKRVDESGITTIGLWEFLLDKNLLEHTY